ncbi:hypothetical protein D9M68_905750 [compost metagenome]
MATGTKLVISSGVIITPQAWIPVFRNEPSKTIACSMVSAPRFFAVARVFSSTTFSYSSGRRADFNAFSSKLNILASFIFGMSLAILSASNKGKSNTLAVSRIDDLAAMVPYVII